MKRRLSNQEICDLTLQSAFPLCDDQDERFRQLLDRLAEVERGLAERRPQGDRKSASAS